MTNKEFLKKKIIYIATHRGSKEMDLLLGNFVKDNINNFSLNDLDDLHKLLNESDEFLYKCYFKKNSKIKIPRNNVSEKLKNFKL